MSDLSYKFNQSRLIHSDDIDPSAKRHLIAVELELQLRDVDSPFMVYITDVTLFDAPADANLVQAFVPTARFEQGNVHVDEVTHPNEIDAKLQAMLEQVQGNDSYVLLCANQDTATKTVNRLVL